MADNCSNDIIIMKDIVSRLKKVAGLRHDSELAERLGTPANHLATWKTRNTVPTDKIVKFCVSNGYDLQFILTGKAPAPVEQPKPVPPVSYSAFPELEKIFKDTRSLSKRLDQTTRLQLAAKLSKDLEGFRDKVKKPKN